LGSEEKVEKVDPFMETYLSALYFKSIGENRNCTDRLQELANTGFHASMEIGKDDYPVDYRRDVITEYKSLEMKARSGKKIKRFRGKRRK
jgi:hypothetical protein